jgi:hypothetical protein
LPVVVTVAAAAVERVAASAGQGWEAQSGLAASAQLCAKGFRLWLLRVPATLILVGLDGGFRF